MHLIGFALKISLDYAAFTTATFPISHVSEPPLVDMSDPMHKQKIFTFPKVNYQLKKSSNF